MDTHSKQQRSYNMSQIRSKDTRPELVLRKALWHAGYRYRLHYKKLPGKPDLVFINMKKAIFINGCFWHKHNCKYFKWPKSNTEYWTRKITNNATRDQNNYHSLNKLGWSFLIIWECELKRKDCLSKVLDKAITFLSY